tara:strand:- start:3078 stop:4523 length:1446 start_codon:yes stop_codon:yes gene_type:complete
MIKIPIIPIILCGGSGTRLWPLSRRSFPKQFLNLNNNENKTFLQETQERLASIKDIHNPILICNEEHRFIVAEQMREINITPWKILLEPFGRNTSAAISLGAIIALEKYEDANLLILSSDHKINNTQKFVERIYDGLKYANKGRLVTFGVIPDYPETGYGYIEAEKSLNTDHNYGENIIRFIEKPDKNLAKKLIKDKKYSWNSGIFLFKAKTIINEINKFEPQINKYCKESLKDNEKDLDFQRVNKSFFEKCPNTSIDIAVMEKTTLGTVLPLDVGWSDIGSWDSVWQQSSKDFDGNSLKGNVIIKNTKDCLINSESRLLVGIGLKELIIVETNDAILISHKSKSQEIKNIVQELQERGMNEGLEHKKIFRPWGHYESIIDDSNWKVKKITVKPYEQLSLQKHLYRSEHWVVVRGKALVQIDNKEMILKENESAYIPKESKHRLSNRFNIPLVLIEIQTGSYLGEDDIQRFEDDYGRLNYK